MACSSILIQRKFSIDVGEPSLKNTYTQFRQWLKDRYGGEMSEDDKKIAVANVDEEIQQLIEGETLVAMHVCVCVCMYICMYVCMCILVQFGDVSLRKMFTSTLQLYTVT